MSYTLAYSDATTRSLLRLDPTLALSVREELLELARTPGLGRSVDAPIPGYFYYFGSSGESVGRSGVPARCSRNAWLFWPLPA